MTYTIHNPYFVSFYRKNIPNNFTGVVKDKDGNIAYYQNSEFHRTDGPAIIWRNGNKFWFTHSKLHREDGPAVEYTSGEKEWYYNNKHYGYNNDFTNVSWTKKWQLEIFK